MMDIRYSARIAEWQSCYAVCAKVRVIGRKTGVNTAMNGMQEQITIDVQMSIFDYLNAGSNKLTVRNISYNETKPFILGIHYARRMPCVQYAFGLFKGDEMIGCVTYGQPASPPLCKGIAGEKNRKNVLELNRLVILPEYNGKNYASYLVGNTLKLLPNKTFVVSYADWGGGIT